MSDILFWVPFVIVLTIVIYSVLIMPPSYKKRQKTCEIDLVSGKNLVSLFRPEGDLVVISLHQTDTKAIPYGWAMITGYNDRPGECLLWMIYIRSAYRGNGFAKELIRTLQRRYTRIITQYERGIINSAGVRLCLSCGFKIKGKMFRNQPAELIWVKE